MSSDTKWIIGTVVGTVVAMTAVVVSVLTFGIGRSLASIDERIDIVNDRIDAVDERIDGMAESIGTLEADVRTIESNVRAIDDKFGTLNTTLLFLTTCIVDLEGPLPVVATTPAALPPGDPDRPSASLMPPQVRLDLPESCRTAHTRALQGAR